MNPFALPLLQSLTLTFFDTIVRDDKSPPGQMLELLSLCSLPALRCVTICTPYVLRDAPACRLDESFWGFFTVHGCKLAALELGWSSGRAGNIPHGVDIQEEEEWIFEEIDLIPATSLQGAPTREIASLTPKLSTSHQSQLHLFTIPTPSFLPILLSNLLEFGMLARKFDLIGKMTTSSYLCFIFSMPL